MAMLFFCPQGHLLEADPSQIGQPCMCPHCQSTFLVPEPPRAAPLELPAEQQAPHQPAFSQGPPAIGPGTFHPSVSEPPQLSPAPNMSRLFPTAEGEQPEALSAGVRAEPQTGSPDTTAEKHAEFPQEHNRELPSVVHLLCPSGHELETPREMLGQDALCPYCQAQFLLRYEDSLEYRRQKAEERAQREEAIAKAWMKWSIAAAIIVVVAVVVMIVMAARL
ncbi:MAG: hypothetical protein HUU20_29015 [Pirellulales bacterium]|nr:hypothetical protein [Pirellulales bacterium]